MVKLIELLNDFNDFSPPEERDHGHMKSFDIKVKQADFEFQYQEMSVPLQACLQYASPEQRRTIPQEFGRQRNAMQFQFYYVDESGEKTQEDQNHENGVIFGLIKQIGGFLNSKMNQGIDTLVYGGDSATRERVYDLFAQRIAKEGWTLIKGQGAGPTGLQGTFYCLLKNGT